MDRHRYIRVAFHGFRQLESDERKRVYLDGAKVWPYGATQAQNAHFFLAKPQGLVSRFSGGRSESARMVTCSAPSLKKTLFFFWGKTAKVSTFFTAVRSDITKQQHSSERFAAVVFHQAGTFILFEDTSAVKSIGKLSLQAACKNVSVTRTM